MPSWAYASARTGSLILATVRRAPSASMRQLGRHHVPVVALGQGEEQVGVLGAGPAQDVLVGAVAAERGARRSRTAGGRTRRVERSMIRDLSAGAVELVGEARPHAATAHDHGFHACSSGIASRTTHTRTVRSSGRTGWSGRPRSRRRTCASNGRPQITQVRLALGRLVDDRRADVAGLEQHGLHAVRAASAVASAMSSTRWALLVAARDVRVERKGPVDLDHVHAHQLGVAGLGEVRGEGDDLPVRPAARQRDDRASELGSRRVVHRCRDASKPGDGVTLREAPGAPSRRVTIPPGPGVRARRVRRPDTPWGVPVPPRASGATSADARRRGARSRRYGTSAMTVCSRPTSAGFRRLAAWL